MNLSIQNLRHAYESGSRTPREVVSWIQERIREADNPSVWIHLLTESELAPVIRRLDESSPADLPLFGVPFAIKDNIDLAGIPTTAGCPDYAYTADESAPVVSRLLEAGAIPIGKTNLDQFATGLVGVRSPYGTPRNPLAADRVPGGSSSGSAVALSEGMVSFSLGTDTAGSGRVPAAFNALWGVKPSRGRLSTRGVVPACRTLDCVSIFAHDADDASTVLRIAEGFDAKDPFSQPLASVSLPNSRRLAIPRADQLLFFGDAGYEDAWEQAKHSLASQGWELNEIDFTPFIETAELLYGGPWVAERFTALESFLTSHPDAFHPTTRKIVSGGANPSARDAFAATYSLARLRRRTEWVWNEHAAMVTPTAGGFPTLQDVVVDPLGPNTQLGFYTNFMNLLDLCAVATPAGTSASGLPFGITWSAPRDSDHALIRIASSGPSSSSTAPDRLSIILFGAHMTGLPMNPQIRELGGTFVQPVHTAPVYRMIHLREPVPARPGIYHVDTDGVSIEGEEWRLPLNAVGTLLASIQAPLGLGSIALEDGRFCHGFLCEAQAAFHATDISQHRCWRRFLVSNE